MGNVNQQNDLRIYKAVHRMLASPEGEHQERRGTSRYPFEIVQWIAPYDGSTIPAEADFFPVRCRDLSRSGFSFVTSDRPAFSSLVVILGEPPDLMHVEAEVARCTKLEPFGMELVETGERALSPLDFGGSSGASILVGCRFVGWLGDV
jgi:hypothetical protein